MMASQVQGGANSATFERALKDGVSNVLKTLILTGWKGEVKSKVAVFSPLFARKSQKGKGF